MLKWRLLVDDGRKSRHTLSQPDLIIAAPLHHGVASEAKRLRFMAAVKEAMGRF